MASVTASARHAACASLNVTNLQELVLTTLLAGLRNVEGQLMLSMQSETGELQTGVVLS
jgi:hypothetical protein